MHHVDIFWYQPNESKSEDRAETNESLHVWIHSEKEDEENRAGVLWKIAKNNRWLTKKVGTDSAILHSFTHSEDSKASPDFAGGLIEETAFRLIDRGSGVYNVPFGGFHKLKMHVKGPSMEKGYKSF
jgi:hypothetical protein